MGRRQATVECCRVIVESCEGVLPAQAEAGD